MFASPASLSPDALEQRMHASCGKEREGAVELLLDLYEYDRQQLYLRHGCSSMFAYCVRELKLRSGAAYRRITCARLLARFPQLEPLLRDGRLCLTGLALLRNVLDEGNADEVIARAAGRSVEELERLVAMLAPQPRMRDCLRRVSVPQTGETETAGGVSSEKGRASAGAVAVQAASTPSPAFFEDRSLPIPSMPSAACLEDSALPGLSTPQPARFVTTPVVKRSIDHAKPLSPELHRLSITVTKDFLDDFAEAKLALSHKLPRGSYEEILREGLRLILKEAKKRRGLTDRPRRQKATSAADSTLPEATSAIASTPSKSKQSPIVSSDKKRSPVPAAVRRAVWQRDGERCTFEGKNGKRCDSRFQLELDHIQPVALGGRNTIENLRVRCWAHNQSHADQVFGEAWMEQFRRRASVDESAASLSVTDRPVDPGMRSGGLRPEG